MATTLRLEPHEPRVRALGPNGEVELEPAVDGFTGRVSAGCHGFVFDGTAAAPCYVAHSAAQRSKIGSYVTCRPLEIL